MKRRKKKNNTQQIKLERKHQYNLFYKRLEYNMNRIGDARALDTFDKIEKKLLHHCRIRPYKIVNAEKEEKKLSAKEIRFINTFVSDFLNDSHVELAGKKISLYDFSFYIETLYFYYRNAEEQNNIRFRSYFPVFETKEFEERRFDVYYKFTGYLEKMAWSFSDLTNYTIRFVKQEYDERLCQLSQKPFFNNYHIEARKIDKEIWKKDNNPRTIYHLFLNTKQQFVPFEVKAEYFGINSMMHNLSIKIFIQKHAIARIKERLGIHFFHISYSLVVMAMYNKPIEIETGKSYLFPVTYGKVKVGYLKAELTGNKLVILTFLFLTNNGTPEGQKLNNIGLEKEDKKYLGIDKLDIFINSDIKNDERLTQFFKSADCGDLFKLDKTLINKDNPEEVARAAFLNHYLGID
ncbi:hypothetical protein [Draconibacterium sp.]|uniref:hypothetical protein n=1 Tax=Draconibacterium sp. TaxID=1965318 RepID=UPI003565A957